MPAGFDCGQPIANHPTQHFMPRKCEYEIAVVGPTRGLERSNSSRSGYLRRPPFWATIATLIATHCIENGLTLLYSDRDFDPFIEHIGLRTAFPTLAA
jgi:hypothetical protein